MTHEIIEELEKRLYKARVDCEALKKTIAILRSMGYGATEKQDTPPPPPIVRPGQGTGKPKHGQITANVKAAIEALGGKQFTFKDVEPLLPETSDKKSLGTRLGQLADAGFLTCVSKGRSRHPAVYQRATPEKPISEFAPTRKEEARAALEKNGFDKFICEGCGESFELCPQKCPKCSGRAFKELELSKDD